MHFATWIPGWNSLDSVRRIHSDLEAVALVFFALLVLLDILAHLSTNDKKKTILEKIGLCCFAIAVLAEVAAYPYGQRNDTLSGQVIVSLDSETKEAKKQAEAAESHLAEALKEATKAQVELNRLKSPRSLTNVAALVSALGSFKGTEFGFWGVFGDQESANLADEISVALQRAGWKPTIAPNAGQGTSWVKLKNFPVNVGYTTSAGVHIQAESEEKVETLQALSPSQLPQQFQAARALKAALVSSIAPAQDDLASSPIGVQSFRQFTAVLIEVGKKP